MPHPSTSSAYGIWSLNEVRDAVRGDNWPVYDPNWFVDVSNITYDNVSFNFSSQITSPQGIALSTDGTRMYVLGSTADAVAEYVLSTAFDVSSASYNSVTFSVASQDTSPLDMSFNSDGTKMYIMGNQNDRIFQYSLSTAFDLSSASYDSVSFSVAPQETGPQGLTFSSDGTKMYVTGSSSDSVYQYSLSTAFDVSTASYDSVSLSVASEDSVPVGVVLNSNGTKMYIMGLAGDDVNEYTLNTAYDISSASFVNNFSVTSQENAPTCLAFSSDGTKMYIAGTTNDTVFQYSTGL